MIRRKLLKLGTSVCIFSVICTLSLTGCNNSKENDDVVETEMVTEITEEESTETEDTEEVESTEECKVTEETENVEPTESSEGTSTETTKQEESGSTTSTESNSSSNTSNNSSNSGSSSSSGSSSGSSSSSSSSGSSSSSSSSSAVAHTHNWTPVYRTVHHDAVTHTEDQGHYEDQGYYRTVYICNQCGARFYSSEELVAHQKATTKENPDNLDLWHGSSSTDREWVSNNVWVSNIVTVTDSPAWDEQVLDHYECSCGATK